MLKTLRGRITASALTTAPISAIASGLLLADATATRCDVAEAVPPQLPHPDRASTNGLALV
jgi:hypothetical protein